MSNERRKLPVIEVDKYIENADWTKRTWDIYLNTEEGVDALIANSRQTPAEMLEMPSMKWHLDNPDPKVQFVIQHVQRRAREQAEREQAEREANQE